MRRKEEEKTIKKEKGEDEKGEDEKGEDEKRWTIMS